MKGRKSRFTTVLQTIKNIGFVLRIGWKYTPGYIIHLIAYAVYEAVELFFEFTYGTKFLLELIQYGGSFRTGIAYVLFVATLILVKIIWSAVADQWLALRSKEILHKKLQEELYQKAVALDLENYDNPQYYTDLNWCMQNSCNLVDEVLGNLQRMIKHVLSCLILGGFVLGLDMLGGAVIIGSVCLLFYYQVKAGKLEFQKSTGLAPLQRQRDYFNRVFYLQSYAKEIRFHQVKDTLQQKFHRSNEDIVEVTGTYGKKIAWYRFLGELLSNKLPVEIGYLLYLLYRTLAEGAFSYGGTIALLNAVSDMKGRLQFIAEESAKFAKNNLFLERLRNFLSLEAGMEPGKEPMIARQDFQKLEVRGITFGYEPEKPILKDVSFTVNKGEKIALVGYNGAGKTTLIKLLLRLYDVEQGAIWVNGKDIREYRKEEYHRFFGCVFHDFQIYAASLLENVVMDAVEGDRKTVEQALVDSGFLEAGDSKNMKLLDTELTREFKEDGMYLSGGQNQKIAIARCFAGSFPILVMDEPSSALDPISEYQMNQKLMELARDKTVIFISHRLSTTKMADRIYMMEDGHVVEQGNHDELMAQGGRYAEMFRMQASRYQNNR